MVALSSLAGAGWQFFDNNGVPLAGGKLYTYAAGTTTPAATYTSNTGLTPNANPIILDSAGRVSSEIWLSTGASYKFQLDTSNNVTLWTKDNIPGIFADKVLTAADIAFTGFKSQTGTVADIADATGSDWIGFDPNGTGAVARSAQDKMRDSISVLDFGAVGDGATDDTFAIQTAINALPSGGILTGLGKTYLTTSLYLKSNMTLRDINLLTKPGNTDFVAPITIDGDTAPKTNIALINVNVNGNRANQTGPYSPTEDGGRHGFRLIGFVSNLKLVRCSGNYCAGDGISLFSSASKPATDAYAGLCFQNIYLEGCEFNWNRRNGMSFDSINGIRIVGCNAKFNGTDVGSNTGTAPKAGFDFEGYGVGTAFNNVDIVGGDFTQNVGKVIFQDGVNPAATGFLPRQNIRISNAHFDVSNSSFDGSVSIYGPNTVVASNLYVFKNIEFTGCRFENWLEVNGVDGLSVTGGSIRGDFAANGYYARVEKSKNWHFNLRTTTPRVFYDALPFTLTKSTLIGTPTYANEQNLLLGFTANGWLMQYSADVTGSATDYFTRFTLSSGYYLGAISGGFNNYEQPLPASGMVFRERFQLAEKMDVTYKIVNAAQLHQMNIIYEVIPYNA